MCVFPDIPCAPGSIQRNTSLGNVFLVHSLGRILGTHPRAGNINTATAMMKVAHWWYVAGKQDVKAMAVMKKSIPEHYKQQLEEKVLIEKMLVEYPSIWSVWKTEDLFFRYRPCNKKPKEFQPKLDETLTDASTLFCQGKELGYKCTCLCILKVLWILNKCEIGT